MLINTAIHIFLISATQGNVMLVPFSGRFSSKVCAPLPNVQVAGWDLGLVWTGKDILAPPGLDHRTFQTVAQ